MAIKMRRGADIDFLPNKMQSGEFAALEGSEQLKFKFPSSLKTVLFEEDSSAFLQDLYDEKIKDELISIVNEYKKVVSSLDKKIENSDAKVAKINEDLGGLVFTVKENGLLNISKKE